MSKKTRNTLALRLVLPLIFIGLFAFNVPHAHAGFVAWLGDKTASGFLWVINLVLYAVFLVAGFSVSVGATMLEFVLDPIAFNGMFNLAAVYDLWRMIRDFFNLFIILMILFIAFATIFQVQAYSYKKLLWHLVLMALLVNFSFPVTRFIIDAANVPMYFFLDSIAPNSATGAGGVISSELFKASDLESKILPGKTPGSTLTFGEVVGKSTMTVQLIQGIIFIFIFGISLVTLAILLFIRVITLLALVIFSPIGFIGTAIPWFSKLANQWWSQLMSNAFFGPTAALMLLVSVKVLQAFKSDEDTMNQLHLIAGNNSISNATKTDLASVVTFAVPLIFIWMSMSVGKSFGVFGANQVIGSAQKFAKSTGRRFSGADKMQRNWKEYRKQREERGNAKFAANNWGTKLGKFQNKKLDQISASRTADSTWKNPLTKLNPGHETAAARQARLRYLNQQRENVDKAAKENLLEHESDSGMKERYKRVQDGKENDKNIKAATIRESISRGIGVDQKDIDWVRKEFGESGGIQSMVTKDVEKRLMEKDPMKLFTKSDGGVDYAEFRKAIQNGKVDREKISTQAWKDANLVRIMNEEKKLDQKFLLDLGKKNKEASDNIAGSINSEIGRMASGRAAIVPGSDEAKALNRLHVMYTAKEGKFHNTADEADKASFFKKADFDAMKNMDEKMLEDHAQHIAENMNPKQFANTMRQLAEDGKDLSTTFRSISGDVGSGSNADNVRSAIKKDPRISTIIS
ncbi:MAG TPA: hypothetical protein VN420_01945 [Candidatus Fimivivens sp.]|nr:hypothetical protein [Candidatus Fimivivens sp.]